MSGDLDIHHGGAIAVDTDALRDVGTRLAAVGVRFADARAAIARAHAVVAEQPGFASVDAGALSAAGDRAAVLGGECGDAAVGTLLMADAFELVELRAQARAMGLADTAPAAALQARIEHLTASDERIATMADWLVAGWKGGRFEGLGEQYDLGGLMAPLFSGGALAGILIGLGTVRPGMTLRGVADPVTVAPVRTSTPSSAPSSLADAFRRFPTAPGAQVRIEQYVMTDGTKRYMAYIKGSQSVGIGGAEPWDMRSNTQLYTGEKSASYQATLDALEAAGAEPGDRVDIVAHSQGGVIAAHLAMESEYDVQVQMTAGSPVEPTLDDDQLLIQLRHTDDVVSSLAAGGSPDGTGSPDSFTAEREADPAAGLQDLLLAPHQLDAYIETAEQVDASGDPRTAALDELWSELDGAIEITATEYHAERDG
ncbi:hypothetical protein [Microbacterium saperdae]|uniref:PGAP1-like protein n=1 Tax=Microbacterium saperdae TaxID=69368 RepID=A0A543BA21_9MICO|nr:hypothetical protein [Microbacterium saperdae]TQL81680.1 hypothetical protein FB560_3154 [Microbacterium saperdae]GGM33957.1 hypothetical protein GCM10010489_00900 [Microbacterium saperdae]